MSLESPVNPSPAGSRAGCIGELALARAGAGTSANDKLVATRMISVVKNRNDGCRQRERRDLIDAKSWLRGLFRTKCAPMLIALLIPVTTWCRRTARWLTMAALVRHGRHCTWAVVIACASRQYNAHCSRRQFAHGSARPGFWCFPYSSAADRRRNPLPRGSIESGTRTMPKEQRLSDHLPSSWGDGSMIRQ